MSANFAIKKVVTGGSVDEVSQRVSEAIKAVGFGVLTRIDFDKKIKEKLGEQIRPCVILGACNPKLALEAYKQSSDTALLVSCNIAVTEIEPGQVTVEAIRPSQMLQMLPSIKASEMILNAERDLEKVILSL